MASAVLKPDSSVEANPSAVFDAVGRLVHGVDPHAVRCRIVYENADGERGVIPVPLRSGMPDDLEEAIVVILSRLKPGEWTSGKSLSADCDTDRRQGNFKRAIRKLRDAGKIDSHPKDGYRLKF